MNDMRPPLEFQVPFWDAVNQFAESPKCSTARAIAVAEINGLVAQEFTKRDERIAELNSQLAYEDIDAQIDIARAEVPEWCQRFVRKVYDSFGVGEYGGYRIDKSGISSACHMLTETRLRACGIEIP
jgi:hypothetical protein